jgi:hypothetical protein
MNNLGNLGESIRSRRATLLPGAMVFVLGLANMFFCAAMVVPQWRAYDSLNTQIQGGQQAIDATLTLQDPLADSAMLERQKDKATATLGALGSPFLTEQQAQDLLNNLYVYARESSVEITSLQVPAMAPVSMSNVEGATAEPALPYAVSAFRLQVEGPTTRLMNFVARLQEASAPSVVISNLSIGPGMTGEILTLNLTVYTSPYALGGAFDSLAFNTIPTPIIPTATPTITPSATITETRSPDSWGATGTAIWIATNQRVAPNLNSTPTPTAQPTEPPSNGSNSSQQASSSASSSQPQTQPQQPVAQPTQPPPPTAIPPTQPPIIITQIQPITIQVPIVVTATFTPTWTPSATPTATTTPTETPTVTPTLTPTSTPTETPTPTPTPTPTETPTP